MENTLPLLLSFILLVFPLLSAAQTDCTITLNSVLRAGGGDPPWLSNSQEFAFGFRLLRSDEHDDGEDLFLLSKLLLSEQSRAPLTHIRGTIGYFAPEWFGKASITVKADVYSFGVMLLEIVCCVSCVKFGLGDEALVDWAYDCYREGEVKKMVENDEEARNDMKGVERVVMVGIWCIQEDPSLRPSMRRVTQMLEGVAEISVPPRPMFFSSFRSVHFQDLDDAKMSIKWKSFDM